MLRCRLVHNYLLYVTFIPAIDVGVPRKKRTIKTFRAILQLYTYIYYKVFSSSFLTDAQPKLISMMMTSKATRYV